MLLLSPFPHCSFDYCGAHNNNFSFSRNCHTIRYPSVVCSRTAEEGQTQAVLNRLHKAADIGALDSCACSGLAHQLQRDPGNRTDATVAMAVAIMTEMQAQHPALSDASHEVDEAQHAWSWELLKVVGKGGSSTVHKARLTASPPESGLEVRRATECGPCLLLGVQ